MNSLPQWLGIFVAERGPSSASLAISFADDSGFHAPENKIKLIQCNADTLRESRKTPFERQILLSRDRGRHRSNSAVPFQVSQDVAIENCESTVEADVPKKVCRLFVAEPHDIVHKPLALGRRIRMIRESSENCGKLFFQSQEVFRLRSVKPDVRCTISENGFRINGIRMERAALKFLHDFSGALRARLWCEKAVRQFVKVL